MHPTNKSVKVFTVNSLTGWRSHIVLTPLLLLTLAAVSAFGQTTTPNMTNEKLGKILAVESKKVEGVSGNWRVRYREIQLLVITDQTANRMRIISPIIEEAKLTDVDLKKLMEANFESALDAKYALYNKVLWSTYVHPLSELTEGQVTDALKQVYSLLRTYGTTYSSTGFVFGTERQTETRKPVGRR